MSKRIDEFTNSCIKDNDYTSLAAFYLIKISLFPKSGKLDMWRTEAAYHSLNIDEINDYDFDSIVNLVVCSEFDEKIKRDYKKHLGLMYYKINKFLNWLKTGKYTQERIEEKLMLLGL